MPSIHEIQDAVAELDELGVRLMERTAATATALDDHAQRLAYLGQGSRSGELAARTVDACVASLERATTALDQLGRACERYREALQA